MDEQPFAEHFEYANDCRFAMLSLTGDDLHAEIHSGVGGEKSWKTASPTKLLA